ncbi:hypothetical protein ACFX2B_013248 [Malus domestica]
MLLVRKSLNCRTPKLLVCTSIKGNTKRSLPARAETATRHQLLFVRKSLNCRTPKLLVRTSIKGNTNALGPHEHKRRHNKAPCLHELKLQNGTNCSLPARAETATRHQSFLARKSINCVRHVFELRYDLISSLEGYVGISNIQLRVQSHQNRE